MPTARDVFPPGTPGSVCEDWNRRRKARIIAMDLFRQRRGQVTEAYVRKITDARMDETARSAGVNEPGGTETRSLVRAELRILGGLPPQPEDVQPTTIAHLPSALDLNQLTALLSLGTPVVLVPVQVA
ncbi:hypothetical protein ABR737_00635 [Streptomyces sp. Edi2]|uniref:hypothetical protein n=1 Tax=Streptomyces sp. Edi2 TaxID=3162528 RepID=UPI00330643A0